MSIERLNAIKECSCTTKRWATRPNQKLSAPTHRPSPTRFTHSPITERRIVVDISYPTHKHKRARTRAPRAGRDESYPRGVIVAAGERRGGSDERCDKPRDRNRGQGVMGVIVPARTKITLTSENAPESETPIFHVVTLGQMSLRFRNMISRFSRQAERIAGSIQPFRAESSTCIHASSCSRNSVIAPTHPDPLQQKLQIDTEDIAAFRVIHVSASRSDDTRHNAKLDSRHVVIVIMHTKEALLA